MQEIVDRLNGVLDDLAGLDLDTLDDASLNEVTIGLLRSTARLAATVSRCVARWDARGVWAGDQSRSAATRLARDVNCSVSRARTELRRARDLAAMPATAASLAAGEVSADHLDLLARARRAAPAAFADGEAMLVDQCRRLRFEHACRVVAYWRQRADSDGAAGAADRQVDATHLHVSSTFDGMIVVDGALDPIRGAVVTGELDRLEQQLHVVDERDGTVRTRSQRLAAALVEMATRSASTPADARRPRPLFVAHIGEGVVRDLCELAAGTVITPGALARHVTDADLEVVLFDGPHTMISVSHRRSFTGAVRRAIQARDRHCQHPSGCDVPAEACDVDHIVPHPAGGATDQFNGRSQCATHNRHPHRHDRARPRSPRAIDERTHELARIRWRLRRQLLAEPDDPDPPDPPDDG